MGRRPECIIDCAGPDCEGCVSNPETPLRTADLLRSRILSDAQAINHAVNELCACDGNHLDPCVACQLWRLLPERIRVTALDGTVGA